MNKCVFCQKETTKTIEYIPVCQEHYQEYQDRSGHGLPDNKRPIFESLEAAQSYRQAKENLIANYDDRLQDLRQRFADELNRLYDEYRKRQPDIFLEDGTITLPKSSLSQID